jgi:CheY-like chemotaxis protein
MRIAYVEDNPTNLALVERVASMNRHIIVPYSEGEVAAQELLREKFELILMDVELAGEMGGLQVVRRLRENGLKTPIVAVTAYAMAGDREKCIEAGCNDYLPKPLPINELILMMAKYDPATAQPDPEPVPAAVVAPDPVTVAPANPAPLVAPVKPEEKAEQPPTPVDTKADSAPPEPVKVEEVKAVEANPTPGDAKPPVSSVSPVNTDEKISAKPAEPVADPGKSTGVDHTE